jgi:preprotein translocase subunit SecD
VATPNAPKPGRPLAVLALGLLVLFGIMAVTGSWKPKLGLDLQGGTSITLTANTPDGGAPSAESMAQAIEIIRNRVDGAGAAEAEVSIQGSNNIIVQVPGVGEEELVQLIGQTAELRFRPVLAVIDGGTPPPQPTSTPSDSAGTPAPTPSPTDTATTPTPAATPGASPSGRPLTEGLVAGPTPTTTPTSPAPGPQPTAAQPEGDTSGGPTPEQIAALNAFNCATIQPGALDDPGKPLITCDREGTTRFLLGPADIVGTDITDATAGIPQGDTAWVVNLEFSSEAADTFYKVTQELSQKTPPQNAFAIVLDGRVMSFPEVNEPIPGGRAQITGNFTQQEAQDLANILKYGALPLTFTTSEVTTVSPALGSEQLRAGLIAGAVGLVLVVLYSLLFYRALGIVSIMSLAVAAALTYATVVLLGVGIGFTLILAGVIGVIVAIGITADSFVVFFERVRDEIREGRTIRTAVEKGWVRGRRTILVADAVTFLAAVVLYFLAIGRVQNFAFTLGLTTLIDVVVVFLFTKPFVTLLVRRKFFGQGHPWSGLNPQRIGRQPVAVARGLDRAGARGGAK